MGAPVALPASFVRFGASGAFFAIADGLQTVNGHSQLHQEIARGRGTPIAQSEVVFSRTALVAVTFDSDRSAREVNENSPERFGIGRQGSARVIADIVRIVIVESVTQIGLDSRLERAATR